MRWASIVAALVMAPLAAMAQKLVIAHYMMGDTFSQTQDEWNSHVSEAQAAGVDAFALNFDEVWTTLDGNPQQIDLAFSTAQSHGFKVFFSFDFALNDWTVSTISNLVNQYKGNSAYLLFDGKPFVSTFEGPTFADSWASVQANTGDLYFVPNWDSLGPTGVASHLSQIEGAFAWQSWPQNQDTHVNTDRDVQYQGVLKPAGKTYMMGVSPWFYKNIPGQNWLWDSDTLWYDRWEEVLQVQPDFVQIISWNDYSESHYIGDIHEAALTGAPWQAYSDGFVHAGWQFILPYYTAAYKNGVRPPSVGTNGAVFYYRTTPKNVCSDGGTTCHPNSGVSATQCTTDTVNVITAVDTATTVTISIGGSSQTINVNSGIQLVQSPFNGRTGDVVVTINGASATGPKPITNNCPSTGFVNFNPVVGSVTAGSGSGGSTGGNTCSSPVSVTFNEIVTTVFGEEVYIAGSIAQLGNWDPNSAVHLDSSKYTDSNHLWFIDLNLPAGTSFEYKFIVKGTDGTFRWESDPNRSFTVPTSCGATTENDTWR